MKQTLREWSSRCEEGQNLGVYKHHSGVHVDDIDVCNLQYALKEKKWKRLC